MERTERDCQVAGTPYRVLEAWRAGDGHGVAYAVALAEDGGEPSEDDREDRRFLLGPDEELAALADRELARRVREEGRPLTATERRFRAPDGRLWLAQSVGPVWAEGAAEGLASVLFTSLEGPLERATGSDGHVGRLAEEELAERWTRTLSPPGASPGDG